MHVVTQYPNGVFSWVDLATTDPEGAKQFYGGLFGWSFDDLPTDMGTVYTMCRIDGKNVAGLSGMSPEMQQQGIPPFWSSYVKNDDVDAIAEKAAAAGGHLLFPPMDVMEEGRMTMFADPTGATVGVWQPRNHIGAQLVNAPNTLVWNELQTRDVAAAKDFYHAVFGWEHSEDENGYITAQQNGRTHAGILQMTEEWDESIPANWAVYFMAADVAAATAKAEELGGTILVRLMSAGEMGAFSVVRDPQGAVFTLMQFDGPVDPPPGA